MLIAEEIWSNIKARNDSQKYFKIDSVEDKLFSPTSKSIGLVVHERFYVLPLKEYQLDFDNLEKLNRLQESFIPKYLNLDMSKQRFLINPSNKIPTLGEIKILEEIAYADFKYKKGLVLNNFFAETILPQIIKFPKIKIVVNSAIRIIPSEDHFAYIKVNSSDYLSERKAYAKKEYYNISINP